MCKTIITDIDIATAISRALGQRVVVRVKEFKQREENDVTKELTIYNTVTKKNIYAHSIVTGDIYKRVILNLITDFCIKKKEDEVR